MEARKKLEAEKSKQVGPEELNYLPLMK